MGFDLAASVGVAALIGWWIDGRYDTSPWGVVICSTIGIIGGLLNFVRAGQRAARSAQRQAEQEAEERDDS
jgi:F0F1-type ATP synthase assembly protein I